MIVQPSGAKSWALRYRAAGKPAKYTLGPYPQISIKTARKLAEEAIGKLAGGNDPAAAKTAARAAAKAAREAKDHMADVASVFVERSVKRSAGELWARETQRLLDVEILPKLGAKRIGEVRRADVHGMLDGIVDRGRGTQQIGPSPSCDECSIGQSSAASSTRRRSRRSKRRRQRRRAIGF
jgi:Arm DNA-binding domain